MPLSTLIGRTEKRSANLAKSQIFNIDNGAGTTIDETVIRPDRPFRLIAARIVYDTETAGTVAGANMRLGVAVGGATVAASTAYTNSSVVGATTAVTLLLWEFAANTPIIVRHTGIAATAAGQAHLELEWCYQ